MNLLHRLKSAFLGFFFMIIGLCAALVFLSMLSIIINFTGNAIFPSECGVVFGSAVHRGVEAGPGISRRVKTAVRLLEEGSVERLFLTGGLGEGNVMSEARVMRNVALKMGIDPNVLRMEETATSTWENIAFLRQELTECDSVVGISDRYHLSRIRLISWLQGIPIEVYPAERVPDILFELRAIVREVLAHVYVGWQFVTFFKK